MTTISLHFNGGISRRVRALVFGVWAVHLSHDADGHLCGYWNITHVPTGMRLLSSRDAFLAIKRARELHRRWPADPVHVSADGLEFDDGFVEHAIAIKTIEEAELEALIEEESR